MQVQYGATIKFLEAQFYSRGFNWLRIKHCWLLYYLRVLCKPATKYWKPPKLIISHFEVFFIITDIALLNRMMQFLALLDKGSQTKVKVIVTPL